MWIYLESPLTHLEVALVGLILLFMGTSNISLFHFPPQNWWQMHEIPKAPCSGCSYRIPLRVLVTFAWYSSMISLSLSMHSEREPNSSVQQKPSTSEMSQPSQRDWRKQTGCLTYLMSQSAKRHFQSSPLLASAQVAWGKVMFSVVIFSTILMRSSMRVALCLQLQALRKRVPSAMILNLPLVCPLKQSLQRRAPIPALNDPTITTSSLFLSQLILLRQVTACITFCDPLKWRLLSLYLIGPELPMQLPPSQLRITTFGQLVKYPPSSQLSIPARKPMLVGQFFEEPKSIRLSCVMNSQHWWMLVARSCFMHHPKSISSQQMSSLLGITSTSRGSGEYVQIEQGEPSMHIAPVFTLNSTCPKKFIPTAPHTSSKLNATTLNILIQEKLLKSQQCGQERIIVP